jgi:hypothetical protein
MDYYFDIPRYILEISWRIIFIIIMYMLIRDDIRKSKK